MVDGGSGDTGAGSYSRRDRVNVVGSAGLSVDEVSLKNLPEGTVVGHFSAREKVLRLCWGIVQATLFRWSPRRADGWRGMLLRLFGAKVGRVDLIRATVRIEVPWNIELGDDVQLGDSVYLYSLGPISIGDRTIISQFAHLCAGTHDHERLDFPLIRVPIRVGADCWIATDSYVAPGVTIEQGVVVGARANVVKRLPAWTVCVGSPARPVGKRVLRHHGTGRLLSPPDDDAEGAPEGAPRDAGT